MKATINCPYCGKEVIIADELAQLMLYKNGIEYGEWEKKYPNVAKWLEGQGFIYDRSHDKSLKK